MGAILLFVVFRLIQYLVPVLFANNKKYKQFLRILPVGETAVWLLFFSWYVFRFAEITSMYALIVGIVLLVLVFWISRFFLRDLIAGMFVRSSGHFKEGEIIIHESYQGAIRKFGLMSLEVETQDGRILFLPYHKLLDTYSGKNESEDTTAAFSFRFEIQSDESGEELVSTIKSFILSLPWSSVHKQPMVYIEGKGNNLLSVEVTSFPIEKEFGKKIERRTLAHFTSPKEHN